MSDKFEKAVAAYIEECGFPLDSDDLAVLVQRIDREAREECARFCDLVEDHYQRALAANPPSRYHEWFSGAAEAAKRAADEIRASIQARTEGSGT